MSTVRTAASVDLSARIGSVRLANPVMTASGTAGHGAELAAYLDLRGLGAVVVKSVSAGAWAGNPAPRLLPLPAGMLNSVGLQNPGVDAWLNTQLPPLARAGATVVASIWGFRADEYRAAAAAIGTAVEAARSGSAQSGSARSGSARSGSARSGPAGSIVAVEANISCPNIEDRSRMFAHSAEGVAEAIGAVVNGLGGAVPVWAKLSPNVTDLPALAAAAIDSGAEAVTLVNTLMGLAIDPLSGRARLGAGGGGLSGPAIHPVAVRAVFECRAAMPGIPIIGVGGVSTGEEAAELLAAGADAVQVGTATFADPRAPARVLAELHDWCAEHGVATIDDLKGRAHDPR